MRTTATTTATTAATLLATVALAACTPKVATDPVPVPAPPTPPAPFDPTPLFETTSFRGGDWNAAGDRLLVSTDEAGTFDVVALPVDGSPPERLTDGSGAEWAVGWLDDGRFLYQADADGNELFHLYVRAPGEDPVDLTPADGARASFLGFNDDRSVLYVATNERDKRAMDVYRYEVADDWPRTMLFENTDALSVEAVRPDGRYVLLEKSIDNANSELYLFDASAPDAALRHLTARPAHAEGSAERTAFGFEPGSDRVWYGTNAAGEFTAAWSIDLETDERQQQITAEWDVRFVSFSKTGKYRVHGINADGRTQVSVLDQATGEAVALPTDAGAGIVSGVGFSRAEDAVRFYVSSDTSPGDLHVWSLDAPAARQLTHALADGVDPDALVASSTIRLPSADGVEIPALLYKPVGASPTSKAPALVFVHGGPGGQSRPSYRAEWQSLVAAGYAVLAINNRGSSGYGKTFFHLDDRRHGEADLADCVAAHGWLASQDWVDPDRIGIMGGSYGGYLTLAALAFEPEVFDAGIDIFGVANWVRTLESIPPWWTAFKDRLYTELGDPASDRDRLLARSPLAHPDGIVRPLLVIQGANDPRVLKIESDEIVAAVQANGVPVDYLVFDDEGHGFRKRANRIAAQKRIHAFLETHLGAPGERPAPDPADPRDAAGE